MSRRRADQLAHRVALSGLLIAMMLVLGYVESQIPAVTGIPGIKLGLSNGVLIFAVYMLDLHTAWILMVLKVTLSGLLFSGFSGMMYAMAGGVFSLAVMTGLSRVKGIHPVTVSVAGGVCHNVAQVAVAMLLFKTRQLLFYMAVLMAAGMVCGALTGVCATAVMRHLKTNPNTKKAKAE